MEKTRLGGLADIPASKRRTFISTQLSVTKLVSLHKLISIHTTYFNSGCLSPRLLFFLSN
jgi:hypothetical protein